MCNTLSPCQTSQKLKAAQEDNKRLREELNRLLRKQITINDLLILYLGKKKAPEQTMNEILTAIKTA